MKSFNGCWTCRVRRKKCDEKRPVCDGCAALYITCHYGLDKPEWMDGGEKQEAMAQRLKREVKRNSHHRRPDLNGRMTNGHVSGPGAAASNNLFRNLKSFASSLSGRTAALSLDAPDQISSRQPQNGLERTPSGKIARETTTFAWSDTILLAFYFEHVFPFLFPFHAPCPLQGGRAWILRLIISSPVVRQAVLCQSSYFLSLSQGSVNGETLWETVLNQTRDAFEVLRESLQVIQDSDISQHVHGTVRILASIVQVLRFETAVLSFDNSRIHLNAALALFRQLLDKSGSSGPTISFNLVMDSLKQSSAKIAAEYPYVPSPEQTAFRFTSSLLLLDDIIASTALQKRPVLYEYHNSLLGNRNGTEPTIDLVEIIGCQNWVLLQLGEIAMLDELKQQSARAGDFDVVGLLQRAINIRNILEANLLKLELGPVTVPKQVNGLVNVLTSYQRINATVDHNPWITQVWAHAALIYLSVVVSQWQPTYEDIRYHVGRIIEILTCQVSPPTMLRTMVWPFCVAGCLAEPAQEDEFRKMVHALQPASVFNTVRQALAIMENVWNNRNGEEVPVLDLGAWFRTQGDLVLLV